MQHIPPSPRSSSSLPVARSYVEIFVCELIIKIHAYVTWLLSSNHSWYYVYAVVYKSIEPVLHCKAGKATRVKYAPLGCIFYNFFSLSLVHVCVMCMYPCVCTCVCCVCVCLYVCVYVTAHSVAPLLL